MKNNNEIIKELIEIAPELANLKPRNSFAVPQDYFAKLPIEVLNKIKTEEAWESAAEPTLSPLLQTLKKKQPFNTPQNYFQTSAAHIIHAVRSEEVADEVKSVAPTLASIKKRNVLAVPQNYFSNLPARLLDKVMHEQTLKNSEISPLEKLINAIDEFLSPIFKPQLAFAFSLIFSIAVGIWFLQTGNHTKVNPIVALDNQLNRLSVDEVNKYIASNIDEFDEQALKKKVGEINSVVIINSSSIDENKLEEIILRDLDEDMLLELQLSKNKNSMI
jgi:hypothetical protein